MSYQAGKWNVVCDVCGFEFYNDQLKKRWDGLMVCEADWEPRHPQDFVKGVPDDQAPPWSRPDEIKNFDIAPTITTQPLTQSKATGQPVTFTVVVDSATPVSYQWYFGATPIANAIFPSYVIPAVSAPRAGNYTVQVTNVIGTTTSSIATLTVT